jgi:pimeloyl-ACP methyl ester carboxylesterase
VNLFFERCGGGRPLLFIHGSGWNRRMWHGQRDGLQSSADVVLVDLPGHGGSGGEGCDSVEGYRGAIVSTLAGLGIDKCCVAGHSLGGAIALSLALSHPHLLEGLILIGSGARLRVLPQILDTIRTNKQATVRAIADLAFSPKAPSDLKDFNIGETMKCDADIIFQDFTACDRFDAMGSVASVQVPTLIICGTDDSLTPPKYSHYLHKAIAGSRLVLVEEAGHMVMMEKPGEVNGAIKEFLGDAILIDNHSNRL